MVAYYNEYDPYAAQWLRNLIDEGLIAPGIVDDRSISDVVAADLDGFEQVHLFAGIGGWSLAARSAGWPDDRPLWTGSCPCQPFSSAGLRKGTADARHLWPEFFRLIHAHQPAIVMGEQVADAAGRGWLDRVWSDMEAEDYDFRPIVLPACSVDAPHERNRLWFLAHPHRRYRNRWTNITGRQEEGRATADRAGQGPRPWDGAIWTPDHRGINRRTPPGVHLLGHGIPARVERLRAYANAIVPQVAAEVIAAWLDVEPSESAEAN